MKSIVLLMLFIIPLNRIWSKEEKWSDVPIMKGVPVVKLPDATYVEGPVISGLKVTPLKLTWNSREAYLSKADEEKHWGFTHSSAVLPEPVQLREYKRKRKETY